MVSSVILVLIFLLVPAGVLWLCRRVRWVGKIGPILVLYLLGVIIGNIGLIPGLSLPANALNIQKQLSGIMVPAAIPMMLLGCSFKLSDARGQFRSMITCMLATALSAIIGFLVFGKMIDANCSGNDSAAMVGGMITGVETGGTVNMASLKTMLGATDSLYLLMNGADMLVSFVFLMFIIAYGIKMFRKCIAGDKYDDEIAHSQTDENPYKGLGSKKGLRELALLIVTTAVICGIAYATTLLFPNAPLMTTFILALTTLSIAASFIPRLHNILYSYDVGMYCIYIFSIVVASMANVREFNLSGGFGIVGYMALVITCTMFIALLFSWLLHLDADTSVIAMVALICSPPFVPMIAAAMRNKRVIAAGIAIGLIGYAAGTYMGYLIFRILSVM